MEHSLTFATILAFFHESLEGCRDALVGILIVHHAIHPKYREVLVARIKAFFVNLNAEADSDGKK